jgi:hypothetical protein
MSRDFDALLRDWEYKPGMVQARLVKTRHGREVIQVRVDLGMLQMEPEDRPDGASPHGYPTYFDYLKAQAKKADRAGKEFALSEDQCEEADREFTQFYHRRIAWLTLRSFDKAMADADHTLAFMDFVKRHSPSDEYTQAHEQYRGFVIFQRTQAAAAQQAENQRPEAAIDAVRTGLDKLRTFFAAHELEEQMDDDGMVQHLRKIDERLRQEYGIETTLLEQLEQAVAQEDYERAARLRDELKRRT